MTKEEEIKALEKRLAKLKEAKAEFKIGDILYSEYEEELYKVENIHYYADGDVYYSGKYYSFVEGEEPCNLFFTRSEDSYDTLLPDDVKVISAKQAEELIITGLFPNWF